jgi:hypothetical protein
MAAEYQTEWDEDTGILKCVKQSDDTKKVWEIGPDGLRLYNSDGTLKCSILIADIGSDVASMQSTDVCDGATETTKKLLRT